MSKNNERITITIECPSCEGTGLYQGFAEKDGAAVVCYTCNGTGETTYSYREFTGRKRRDDVTRIFDGSHGYCHGDSDVTTEDGTVLHFSQFGCSYEDWLNGATPKPMEELYCPYMWKNTGMGNEPCVRCREGNKGFGRISDCTFYGDKATCWKEFHSYGDKGLYWDKED